jgi:5-methylcytosine-specific restriction endonuclease McrA
MPIRLCLEPRCGNPATGRGRCDEHRKAQEAQRSRARRTEARERNRMYARKRWAMTRKAKLFANPICELEHPGCLGIATEVHHKIAMEDGGAEYAMDNLVTACKPRHARKPGGSSWSAGEPRDRLQRGSTGVASAGSPPQESNLRAAAAGASSKRTRAVFAQAKRCSQTHPNGGVADPKRHTR